MAEETPSERARRDDPAAGRRTLGLLGLLLELALPTLLSAAALLIAASRIAVWNLRTTLGLAVFAVLLVLLALLLAARIDVATLARRRRRGKRQLLNRAGPIPRLVKVVLGGLAIPIAAFVAANKLDLGGRRTPMSLAIELGRPTPPPAPAELVAAAIRRAAEPAVRAQGIAALAAMRSSAALEQLLRLLDEDPGALRDAGESEALSRGLASFGAQATGELVRRCERATPAQRRLPPGPGADAFDRYFADGFAALEREVAAGAGDPSARAAAAGRLEAASAGLRAALAGFDASGDGGGVPSFVLATLLRMGDAAGPEALAFARRTAADPGWSDAVRGQALQILARLGDKDDVVAIYRCLDAPGGFLRARALQAVAVAEARRAAAPAR